MTVMEEAVCLEERKMCLFLRSSLVAEERIIQIPTKSVGFHV